MATTVNRDNYDQVEFDIADAAPDSCFTQPMRNELKKGLRGWISRLRNVLAGLLRAADQSDNLTVITGDGAIFTAAAKEWKESQQVADASGEDVDVTFTQFVEAGIDGVAAFLMPYVVGGVDDYGKIHYKAITSDEIILTVTDVAADIEVFLRLLEVPKAGTQPTT